MREPDAAATNNARLAARETLNDRLPAVAAELKRFSDAIRNAQDNLDDPTSTTLAEVFERLTNPRDSLGAEEIVALAWAVDMLRGKAFVARNGDWLEVAS